MSKTADLIDLLGGSYAVAEILSAAGYRARRNSVGNWRKRGFFPPESYLVFQSILRDRGLHVDPTLWRMATPLKNGRG